MGSNVSSGTIVAGFRLESLIGEGADGGRQPGRGFRRWARRRSSRRSGRPPLPDQAVERQIGRAFELQQTDQTAANAHWALIDRMIVDRAPLVPMYNLRGIVFTSARVGDFQYHPLWFTLLDQLWLR